MRGIRYIRVQEPKVHNVKPVVSDLVLTMKIDESSDGNGYQITLDEKIPCPPSHQVSRDYREAHDTSLRRTVDLFPSHYIFFLKQLDGRKLFTFYILMSKVSLDYTKIISIPNH